jgi:MFS family permease
VTAARPVTAPAPLRRNRDFLLLQTGQLLSTFGSGMSGIAYPLLALTVTGSAAKTGYVGAVEFAPLVLLSAAAGVAADRYDRRRLMIASDVVGAAAVGALAAAVLAHHAAYWLILAVAFVDSTAAVVFRAGNSGAFRAVVPQSQLADAASVSMARMSIVRLAAPPAGGALFGLTRCLPFLADAVSYGFSTISLLLMRTRFQEEREAGARTHFREGLAYFWRIPFLRTTIGMIAASNLAAAGVPMAVIILAHRHGLPSSAIGGFVALQGVTLLLGSTLSPVLRRLFPMRAILLSEFWTALVYAAFLAYPSVYVLAVAASVHAFWFPNTDSAMTAYSYVLIPDRLLGRAMAASNMLRAASAPIGPLAAGLLLGHASSRLTVLVLAAPVVVAALLGTLSASIRDLPSLAASPAAAG